MNAITEKEVVITEDAESESLIRAHIYHFLEVSLAHPGEDGFEYFIQKTTSYLFLLQYADLLDTAGELTTKGLVAANKFFELAGKISYQEMEAAHISLFSSNYPHLPCPPYGSLFTAADSDKRLEEMLAIKEFYQQNGIDIAETFDDLPDHLCVELEFMQVLCFREDEAAQKHDSELIFGLRATQREFLTRFLIPFINRLADIAAQSAPENPYSHLLEVARCFISYHHKELDKTKAQIDLEQQELIARLTEAETNYERLKLKQRISSDIEASRNVELDMLAVEQARREVEALKERLDWLKKASAATYNIIASRKSRAENKVAQINQGRANFAIKADRDGVVVYKTKWNGEKFQVGENVWSGQPILEIPELQTIRAEAFVPEVDIGKIKPEQRAEISIDAFPGKTYTGKVKKMDTLVRQKAWDIQNKVLSVEIELDQVDTSLMRPAMGIKTKIETGAIADCLFVPLKAVSTTDAGAQVKVRSSNGWNLQTVKLGAANASDIVILEGLKAGDRVASDFTKAKH